jgi:hypothetical protein
MQIKIKNDNVIKNICMKQLSNQLFVSLHSCLLSLELKVLFKIINYLFYYFDLVFNNLNNCVVTILGYFETNNLINSDKTLLSFFFSAY